VLVRELSPDIRIHLTRDVQGAASPPPTGTGRKGTAGKALVNADPDRLQQAIVNLALNAQDAMPEGGDLYLKLTHLHLGPEDPLPVPDIEPGAWACLAVSDTGTGIPPDALPHIFEPFFTTRAPLRKGLGLPQAYGIIKQHGGHLDVRTEMGEGTSLTIYLPALPEPRAASPPPATGALPEGNGETILVMESNPGTLKALAHSLQMLNYRVLTAPDGREALAIFQQHRDDVALILSDLVMPEIGGMALCQALQKLDPNARVVILTDYPKETQEEELDALGVVDWLKKPASLEQLAHTLARALDARSLDRPSEGGRPRERDAQ